MYNRLTRAPMRKTLVVVGGEEKAVVAVVGKDVAVDLIWPSITTTTTIVTIITTAQALPTILAPRPHPTHQPMQSKR